MVYAYLFAAIAGVILLAVSLIGGGDSEHDADGDGLVDHVATPTDGGTDHHHSPLTAASALLSLRTWTYLLAFAGIAGLALRFIAHVGEPFALIAALVSGAGAALVSQAMIRRAAQHGTEGGIHTTKLVGKTGTVLVPLGANSTGKVRVQVNNSTLDVLATTDDAALSARDEVLIVEVRDGLTAHVTRSPTATRR